MIARYCPSAAAPALSGAFNRAFPATAGVGRIDGNLGGTHFEWDNCTRHAILSTFRNRFRATPGLWRSPLLNRLFQRKRPEAQALDLYDTIVAQARRPEFYTDLDVPDTIDGR